jgi:hypothetical protein
VFRVAWNIAGVGEVVGAFGGAEGVEGTADGLPAATVRLAALRSRDLSLAKAGVQQSEVVNPNRFPLVRNRRVQTDRHAIAVDEGLIDGDAEAGTVGNLDHTADHREVLECELVQHWIGAERVF